MKSGKRWLKWGLYLVGVFLFQEMVLRFCFPLPEIENLDRIDLMASTADPRGNLFTRNQQWTWESQPDTAAVFLHKMNLYGFRDREWKLERKAGSRRYLFVGDSFVEGIMAPQDQTIPAGFVKEKGEEAMNAGMVGVGLSSYLQAVADLVPLYQPDVLFLCIYANDLGRNQPIIPQYSLDPVYFSWYKPRLLELIRQIQTHGPVHFRWGVPRKSYLPGPTDPANPWVTHGAEMAGQVMPEMEAAMRQGTFNPHRTNCLFKEEMHLKSPPNLGQTLPFVQEICKRHGTTPVIVYLPSRNQVTRHYLVWEREFCLTGCDGSMDLTAPAYQAPQRAIAAQCQALQMPFIDLSPFVQLQEANGNHLYWKHDEHMRGKGYLLVGQEIRRQWEGLQ
ncbi:MAG: SGNH/GDSL hydrolase family protein [Bacteroidia bacterium]|nr:SGNH/GDSL hydrolase family protein [Bacteroidia bacterium]